jgi:hypothetical protein
MITSCKTIKVDYSDNKPVYRLENISKYNNSYSMVISNLDNPTNIETKPIGRSTWEMYRKLGLGTKLDKKYNPTRQQ